MRAAGSVRCSRASMSDNAGIHSVASWWCRAQACRPSKYAPAPGRRSWRGRSNPQEHHVARHREGCSLVVSRQVPSLLTASIPQRRPASRPGLCRAYGKPYISHHRKAVRSLPSRAHPPSRKQIADCGIAPGRSRAGRSPYRADMHPAVAPHQPSVDCDAQHARHGPALGWPRLFRGDGLHSGHLASGPPLLCDTTLWRRAPWTGLQF